MAPTLTDEELAARFRTGRAQMLDDKRELERRGYTVTLGRKTATIAKTSTTVIEL